MKRMTRLTVVRWRQVQEAREAYRQRWLPAEYGWPGKRGPHQSWFSYDSDGLARTGWDKFSIFLMFVVILPVPMFCIGVSVLGLLMTWIGTR